MIRVCYAYHTQKSVKTHASGTVHTVRARENISKHNMKVKLKHNMKVKFSADRLSIFVLYLCLNIVSWITIE